MITLAGVLWLLLGYLGILPQFPDAATCYRNYQTCDRCSWRVRSCFNWESMPIHPALREGMQADTDAWYWAWLLQNPKWPDRERLKAQDRLIELIGYPRFLTGAMPPVFEWREP